MKNTLDKIIAGQALKKKLPVCLKMGSEKTQVKQQKNIDLRNKEGVGELQETAQCVSLKYKKKRDVEMKRCLKKQWPNFSHI